MNYFNPERRAYYKAKKRELRRVSEAKQAIREDALFIRYYGMSAFLELAPVAKDFGVSWHTEVLEELERIRKRELAQLLSGIHTANAATKSKPANRDFRRLIRNLFKA